jgi:hypothetical protein
MNNQWQPGALVRLPWDGLAALLGAIAGIVGSIVILVVSNGDHITKWSFQPTVYLSIISTLTNIMVQYALHQGTTTAWWSRALKAKTKIVDLHYSWAAGNSLLAALKSGRNFNFVALASILVAISQINGPLLQRASRVALVEGLSNVPVSVRMAPEVPSGYTGVVAGRSYTPTFFTPAFLPVVSDFYSQTSIQLNDTGCNGICSTTVAGAGFAISCSGYNTTVNLTQPDGTYPVLGAPLDDWGLPVFYTNYGWDLNSGNLTIDVQHKPDPGCLSNSTIIVRSCILSTATVKYIVQIDGNQSTVSLPTTSNIYDDEIISDYKIEDDPNSDSGPSTLGGLYLALSDRYNSETNVRWGGGIGYTFLSNGSLATQYLLSNSYDSCLAFNDPTDDLVANARELMFRTAVAAANSSDIQSVPAAQTATFAVYQSHYLYLILANVFTVLAIITVLPTFLGYWHLGRKVSMSPIEIAKAFNAPLLKGGNSNADSSQLVKDLGNLAVRYGAVSTGVEMGDAKATKQGVSASQAELSGWRLQMADEVTQPQKGWVFVG